MKRRTLLGGLLLGPLLQGLPAFAATRIHVYKNPDCGCCGEWVRHLQAAGFAVQVTEVSDTAQTRKKLGMPDKFGSCHTAVADGYLLEGHVPAADVKRLLARRPKALGLAVPGMPAGSPGMEAGSRKDPYQVLLVDRSGGASVFARYN
jgi:hypothetical protein